MGSGAAPTQGPATWVLKLSGHAPDRVARALRLDPAHVIARIARDAVLIDLRTVADDGIVALAAAINRATTERTTHG